MFSQVISIKSCRHHVTLSDPWNGICYKCCSILVTVYIEISWWSPHIPS